jgi:glycerol-3-phosphate acyltransferase PlsY
MGEISAMLEGAPGLILSWLIGFLLGSIPFGLILTRMAGLGDVRAIGSGNIGATNVLRTGHKGLAAATLLLDMLKGTVAVLIANTFDPYPYTALVAAIAAFNGHITNPWLGFKGGKGVATYLGVLIGLVWPAAVVFAVVWLSTAFISRYSSLSALISMVAVPLSIIFRFPAFLYNRVAAFDSLTTFYFVAVMSAVSWYMHRQNIARLIAGTESRIGSKG